MERDEVLRLGEVSGKRVLDVGVGPLALIAARDFKCEVTTIDTSASALESARREAVNVGLADHIQFDQQDAADLSYPDDSFEVAISYGALHHVPVHRRERFLRELLRVARERVVIAEYTRAAFQSVHPKGEYEAVDLAWLEEYLGGLGETVRHPGERMNVYVCRKAAG